MKFMYATENRVKFGLFFARGHSFVFGFHLHNFMHFVFRFSGKWIHFIRYFRLFDKESNERNRHMNVHCDYISMNVPWFI